MNGTVFQVYYSPQNGNYYGSYTFDNGIRQNYITHLGSSRFCCCAVVVFFSFLFLFLFFFSLLG